jgi:hypothetical protein
VTWTPAEPAWAAPSRREIDDLHWLAYRARRELGQPSYSGISRTLAWVRGGRAAPITGRTDIPVTRELATAEKWAANAASTPDLTPPPLEYISAQLGVVHVAPQPVDADLADGAWRALRWLLGEPGQSPPLPLPVRHVDGTVPTADELYDIALAAAPDRFRLPEQRAELRSRVEQNARRYRDLAAAIDAVRADVAARSA